MVTVSHKLFVISVTKGTEVVLIELDSLNECINHVQTEYICDKVMS